MILIVDNYDSFTYNLVQIVKQHDDVHVVRNDDSLLDTVVISDYDGIIFSPGPGRPEDAGKMVSFIQKHYADIPMLGVCLGHQAIAYAFAGKILTAPEIMHGKTDKIFHCSKSIFKELSLPFVATRYHSLIVERESLPKELQVTAETVKGDIMGLVHNDFPVYGLQFHPESIASKEGGKLVEAFIRLCKKDSSC